LFVHIGDDGPQVRKFSLESEEAETIISGVANYAVSTDGKKLLYRTGNNYGIVEVKADQETHLVKWLSKRLGHPLRAPNLKGAGYQLVGGRMLPDLGKSAAQFMYEDSAKRRITVYVRAYQGKEIAFRFLDNAGTGTFYWIESPFAYALSGTLPRSELLNVANLVYDSLAR